MTIDEFVAKLAETRCKWYLEAPRGALRTKKNALPEYGITCSCPIAYLARVRGVQYLLAGDKLGLNRKDTVHIAAVADNVLSASGERHHDRALRARLLAACRLEEVLR